MTSIARCWTAEIFGEYIDVYDMTQAIEDGVTVKVFYEPRLALVDLPEGAREAIDDEFDDATVGSEEEISERLKSKWAKVEAIVGSEKRIAQLAADIVEHWEARRDVLAGKAMIVTMSRRIAVDLYEAIVALRPSGTPTTTRQACSRSSSPATLPTPPRSSHTSATSRNAAR